MFSPVGSSTTSCVGAKGSSISLPGREPPKSLVTKCPSGNTTKLLYGLTRGNSREATTCKLRFNRCAWLPNTTYISPLGRTAIPPGQAGPPERCSLVASVSRVSGCTRSTHDTASSPPVWQSTNTSSGDATTTMVTTIIDRLVTRSVSPAAMARRAPSTHCSRRGPPSSVDHVTA